MEQRNAGITELVLTYARSEPPESVRDIMRLSVLDWAACGIAGARENGFAAWAASLVSDGSVTRLDGRTGSASQAALVNGTLSHALDFDDTHFAHIGHPSVAIVPAALTVAELRSASMSDMVDAALIGAEVSVAVGLWLGREHYQVGYHQTATAGAFGATVAAGRLMGLSEPQMRHALGLCSTMASGLKSQFGTMGKPLNAGLAARCGVEAAQWAEAGMTSAADGLNGPLGFGATHHGAETLPTLEWRMAEVSHKFHACCHGLHAVLEAVRDVDLVDARQIDVFTHPRWMTVCNQEAPDTGLGAKFSYKQVIAMAALGIDTGDIAQFSDENAQSSGIVAFRDHVCVSEDEGLSEMQARVIADGKVYFHDLSAPLSYAVREVRIRNKACALVGSTRGNDIWSAIAAGDLPRFARLLAP